MRSVFQNIFTFFPEGLQTSHFVPVLEETSNVKMNLEHWWNDTDRGKQSIGRKTSLGATFSTKNPTWAGLESNPGGRCGRPATNLNLM
jgi:hypothetical protein